MVWHATTTELATIYTFPGMEKLVLAFGKTTHG
jgi:hypothetical protein